MALTREQILNINDKKLVKVDVPEWGDHVFVKVMNGAERDQFDFAQLAEPKTNVRARLIACTVCDGEGNALFTLADVQQLSQRSHHALDRIFEVAWAENKLAWTHVKELGKD